MNARLQCAIRFVHEPIAAASKWSLAQWRGTAIDMEFVISKRKPEDSVVAFDL